MSVKVVPTFLLVDESPEIRKNCRNLLNQLEYTDVIQTRNGTEAWSVLKTIEANFVICAWRLPDMSGISLLKIIRADLTSARIPFMLTAHKVTANEVIAAGQAGVTDILTLPFHKSAFDKKIQSALEVKEDPKSVQHAELYHQGMELMKNGRFREALKAFKQSLQIFESAEAYYNMGYIEAAQGRYEEALRLFRRATQIDSAHAMSYRKMGAVYVRLGESAKARECLLKAGDIYMEKFMDADAESVLLEALKLNPTSVNVFNTLGILYRRQGKHQEAIVNYLRALKVTTEDENIYYNLARAYISVGNNQEAEMVLKKALTVNPDFKEGKSLLASILSGRKTNPR